MIRQVLATLDRHSPIPLYQQLAERLKDRIVRGEVEKGGLIGSEAELSQAWAVSRITVRKALKRLHEEGLVVARQGKGTFIRTPLIRQGLAKLETLGESFVSQGLDTSMRILQFEQKPAPPEVARALKLSDHDRVLVIRRQHLVSREPIALVTIYVPDHFASLISEEEASRKPVYKILPEKLGVEIGEGVQVIRARNATREEAALLQVEPGAALLVCDRTTTLSTGVPAIYAAFLYRSDRFGFEITLPREHRTEVTWAIPGLKIAPAPGSPAD